MDAPASVVVKLCKRCRLLPGQRYRISLTMITKNVTRWDRRHYTLHGPDEGSQHPHSTMDVAAEIGVFMDAI